MSLAQSRLTGVTLLIEHDVFRFEVSVQDPIGVQVAQGQGDLPQVEATENTLMRQSYVTVELNMYRTTLYSMTS